MKKRTYVNKHIRRLKRRGPDRLVRVKGHPRKVKRRSWDQSEDKALRRLRGKLRDQLNTPTHPDNPDYAKLKWGPEYGFLTGPASEISKWRHLEALKETVPRMQSEKDAWRRSGKRFSYPLNVKHTGDYLRNY